MSEKLTKIEIKLKLNHPGKMFHLQKHEITKVAKVFELNEKEMKELKSAGCQKWLDSKKPEVK